MDSTHKETFARMTTQAANVAALTSENIAALSNEHLILLSNDAINRYSYYLAGWDYPERASRDRDAEIRARDHFYLVKAEMNRRGLHATRPGLVSI